jgi:hypothetical protein
MRQVVVCWPESQMLMTKKGFCEHCELINSEKGLDKYGSSAYLVDEDWFNQIETIEDEDEDYNGELSINYDFY